MQALDGLSLRFETGTVTGIVGRNGAGKTMLIDVMCGLVRPSAGVGRVLGEDVIWAGAGCRPGLALLPQETALYTEVTAR